MNVIRHIDANGDEVELIEAHRGAQEIELEGDELVWAESDGLSVEIHSRPIAGGPDPGSRSAIGALCQRVGTRGRSRRRVLVHGRIILRSDRTPRSTMAIASDLTAADTAVNTLLADDTYLYYLEGEFPAGPRRFTVFRRTAAPLRATSSRVRCRFASRSRPAISTSPSPAPGQFGNHDGNGRIVRREMDGVELQTVAGSEGEPLALAVDDTWVFWIEVDAQQQHTELWYALKDGVGAPARLLTSDLHRAGIPRHLETHPLRDQLVGDLRQDNGGGESFILGMKRPQVDPSAENLAVSIAALRSDYRVVPVTGDTMITRSSNLRSGKILRPASHSSRRAGQSRSSVKT